MGWQSMSAMELARDLRIRASRMRSGVISDEVRERALRMLAEDAALNFDTGTGPDDLPGKRDVWQPLKRPRRDGSTKPLVHTGRLRAAVARLATQQSVHQPFSTARLVSEVPYAVFHQQGTRTIPQRRFLGVGRRLRMRLGPVLAQWLTDWMWRDPGGLGWA